MDVVAFEAFAAVQELERDDEAEPDHLAAQLLDELDLRLRRAAGGEDVVVDEDALAAHDRVSVQLQRIEAVLERVLRAHRPPRELPRLARRDEPAAELARERPSRDEAACLRAQDQVGLARDGPLR